MEGRARGAALQPRVALAWSLVHGFATLMLDNRQFAAVVGDDASRAHQLMGDLLLRIRVVFEGSDSPSGPARTPKRAR